MSKLVYVMSDTHGLLRPEVVDIIEGCDAIFHAGDVDEPEILDSLKKIAPIYIVRGNNDLSWAANIPETLDFKIEDCRFFMIHNRRFLPRILWGVDAVIFGHTHQYFEERINGRLYLNPGSCGWPAFGQEITLMRLIIDKKDIYTKKIVVPDNM